jgi:hypothetical protein
MTNNITNNRLSPIAFKGNMAASAANNGSKTILGDSSVPYNYGGYFNPATGIFTIPKSGIYQFSGVANLVNIVGGNQSYISLNSTALGTIIYVRNRWRNTTYSSAASNIVSCQYFAYFAAGDTVKMIVVSSANYGIAAGTFFSGHLRG